MTDIAFYAMIFLTLFGAWLSSSEVKDILLFLIKNIIIDYTSNYKCNLCCDVLYFSKSEILIIKASCFVFHVRLVFPDALRNTDMWFINYEKEEWIKDLNKYPESQDYMIFDYNKENVTNSPFLISEE